jgi:hypothetical protein
MIWDRYSASTAFTFGATVAILASAGMFLITPKPRRGAVAA